MTNGDAASDGKATTAAAAAAPLVRFEDVSKRFGETLAVDRVSLDIGGGEFFSLLGPSGCGKSTLMRMLAGFERPSAGRILLDGADLADVPAYRRPINMMFQHYALFPHLSVEGNVAFGLKQERLPRTEIRERVREMLALVRLEGFGARMPDQLSGGQKQRVALARALVKRPRVLLLDEPLAALDRKLREETQAELRQLQERLGSTFIMVTHDQDEAMTLSDRIGVMGQGRLVQVAPPVELYERPASTYVATFVGDANVIPATVTAIDGGRVTLGTALGPVQADSVATFASGADVHVAVRPEKVRVAVDASEDAAGANAFTGEVADIAYLGDTSVISVALASGLVVRAVRANLDRVRRNDLGRGDRVTVWWPAEASMVLAE